MHNKSTVERLKRDNNAKLNSKGKLMVPADRRNAYSQALTQAINAANDIGRYQQIANLEKDNKDKLNGLINSLQNENPPSYLTSDMKTYVRRMYAAGKSDNQVQNYIALLRNAGRLPQGRLVNGKAPGRGKTYLPVPDGINPIARKSTSSRSRSTRYSNYVFGPSIPNNDRENPGLRRGRDEMDNSMVS